MKTLQDAVVTLRPITSEDVEVLHRLTDEAALENTQQRVRGFLEQWAQHGTGPWMVCLGQSADVVGMCGVYRLPHWDRPSLAYVVSRQAQGQGVATRAATLVVEHALEELGLSSVWALVSPENLPSRRVLQKLGFEDAGTVTRQGNTSLCLVRHSRNP